MLDENLKLTSPPLLEIPYKHQSILSILWKMLTNSSDASKNLIQAQAYIKQLEEEKQHLLEHTEKQRLQYIEEMEASEKLLATEIQTKASVTQSQVYIKQLEAEKQAAANVLEQLEKAFIELGNSNKTPKTIRHELLAILDLKN